MKKKFFYQLKVPRSDGDPLYDDWVTIWFDIVEATDKAEAKKLIQDEHGGIIAEKVSKKNPKKIDYRVFVVELSPEWEDHWLTVRTCQVCGAKYDLLNAKRNGEWANHDICSGDCRKILRKETDFGDYTQGYNSHRPCIYKITNKTTGMVYIGQTTQCFTLRWYQHFFNAGENKFHQAIKSSKPSDWTFEVIEVIYDEKNIKEILAQREQHWINHYDSIVNGYNSAIAKKELKEE